MIRILGTFALALAALGAGCGRGGLGDYALGTQSYPSQPDCKQAYFKGKPIPGVFLKSLVRADGGRLEGVACHGANIVVNAHTGVWREGKL